MGKTFCRPGLNKTLQTFRRRRKRRRCQQGRNVVDTSQAYEAGPGINSKQNNTAVIPLLRLVVAPIDLHLICMKLSAVMLLRPDRSPSHPLPAPPHVCVPRIEFACWLQKSPNLTKCPAALSIYCQDRVSGKDR